MNYKSFANKKICALLVFFTMGIATVFGGFSTAKDAINHSLDSIVAAIPLSQLKTLDVIIQHRITILDVDRSRTSAVVLVSSEEFSWLSAMNLAPEIVPDELVEQRGWKHSAEFEGDFHSYSQMMTELQNIANTYPAITRLYDLGHSVQGRVLWGLKITDNPDIEENEPEVRICGLHHGNEYMSAELPLNLALHLVQNYGVNTSITDLVDSREIWIIPMVNPDGREAGTRYNAHGIDLNRNYGYMPESSNPYSEPETRVIRDNALQNNFVLSLSFHCSGDIVNYIWNYKHKRTPDNDVVENLSEQYGSHNGYWVTEGYDWYQTLGDCNDFSYGCRGDIDWTIEVQTSNIPQAWNLNRDAMLELIDTANMGLTGVVTNANNGQPLAATVWVDEAPWPCFADPLVGDYHRVLLPGAYTIHYRANGFEEKTFSVQVNSGDPTVLNVALNPSNQFYAYQVTTCAFYAPSDNYQNNPTEGISLLGPPDGVCASLGVGGSIIVDMANSISNLPNASDLKVFEGDATTDGYSVYVSTNWNGPWTNVGTGMGTAEFDLADASVISARYVKIVDDGTGSASEMNPGVDIDALQNLAAVSANQPPDTPRYPEPSNQSINIPTNADLSWTGGDPDNDPVTYDIYFGTLSPPVKVISNQSIESYDPGQLINLTMYYWKIVAWDEHGLSTAGSIWSFITSSNFAPNKPTITGPLSGKSGRQYDYKFVATDPNGDQVFYYIDWGDEIFSGWVGPYASGQEQTFSHTWENKNTYLIKAKTKNVSGAESDWTTLSVTMPQSTTLTTLFYHRWFEQFLCTFPILKHLLNQ